MQELVPPPPSCPRVQATPSSRSLFFNRPIPTRGCHSPRGAFNAAGRGCPVATSAVGSSLLKSPSLSLAPLNSYVTPRLFLQGFEISKGRLSCVLRCLALSAVLPSYPPSYIGRFSLDNNSATASHDARNTAKLLLVERQLRSTISKKPMK